MRKTIRRRAAFMMGWLLNDRPMLTVDDLQ